MEEQSLTKQGASFPLVLSIFRVREGLDNMSWLMREGTEPQGTEHSLSEQKLGVL